MARRMLKSLRIKANGVEYKITGLSESLCRDQKFSLKHGKDANGEVLTTEITLCTLVSLQRYTKALTNLQRDQLVERSRQKPHERKAALEDSLRNSRYGDDPMLRSCGINVEPNFRRIEGRVLPPPKIMVGRGQHFVPRNGSWNFNNKNLAEPVRIDPLEFPLEIFKEEDHFRREPAHVRVQKLYATVKNRLPGLPQLLLCILPDRKNSDLYGPWKWRNLAEEGVVTQCISPNKINDQYITNFYTIPFVSKKPTLILGMDVSHGSPGRSDVPSISAVVSSRCSPEISRYRAAVRTQSSKVEMIANLFKPVSDTEDQGIIRELLVDFHITSGKRKPDQIIIFRDGVSESQFNQVLNIELD
ncbi:hypothetical protein RJT34_17059 [Clitoria ternatea]|uniref:Piwi domain-containing protein n=1 Tax=Clitoria ternatea TaxID=43366 RepID=A0AAN9J894_CLITE